MRSIAQGHERQQVPSVLGGRVNALLDAKPALDLGPSRMMEANDGHQRREARGERGGGYRRGDWRQDTLDFEPIGRDLDSLGGHGSGLLVICLMRRKARPSSTKDAAAARRYSDAMRFRDSSDSDSRARGSFDSTSGVRPETERSSLGSKRPAGSTMGTAHRASRCGEKRAGFQD